MISGYQDIIIKIVMTIVRNNGNFYDAEYVGISINYCLFEFK